MSVSSTRWQYSADQCDSRRSTNTVVSVLPSCTAVPASGTQAEIEQSFALSELQSQFMELI